ncbi:ExbD/TolR family protein [Phaeovulum vinaykumarii]|uniref:Biopolymer transport protein ExbD n=1 Tax=Phaeovulum vinaykumarii TaxID=407234 RepID=A0A1N7L8W3_9RHOB|nr:biopolymer transporter ExbD [Phaeovulum vinaykumarii]SIS70266.1 biopolymer transport protein ExbD [Phaeovulum vinaykumarii]SOB99012.1 biopolymer transport protein ExbD [Phaeovulum vinaykumarii]
MFRFAPPRTRRRPDLTPMIDVVFLLLVFFMLVARFGVERHVPLVTGGAGAGEWTGPARLVDVAPGGALRLNGAAVAPADLPARLGALMAAPSDPVILRAREATLQDLVAAMDLLTAAGFTQLVLMD